MGTHYRHLDLDERVQIEKLIDEGFSLRDVAGGFEEALQRINSSLTHLDLWTARELTLVAAACIVALGHYSAGHSLLDTILTLGQPAVGQERTQAGLLVYAAVFNAVSGNLTIAESLAREAERLDLPPGTMPGTGTGVARATLFNLTGDRPSAIAAISGCFQELLDRGYLLSAVETGMIGGGMFAIGELLARVATLLPQMEGDWRHHYLAYAVAQDNHDTDGIEAGLHHLINADRLATAQYALMELTRLRAAAKDKAGEERAARLSAKVMSMRSAIDVSSSRWMLSRQYQVRANLSPRERELAYLVTQGYSNSQIAGELHVSLRTVETHLLNVYQKLGVNGRAGLRELPLSWD